jgi:alcohol dehydrogenase
LDQNDKKRAEELLKEFKGDDYAFGDDALKAVGPFAADRVGENVAIVADTYIKGGPVQDEIQASFESAGVNLVDVLDGASPNAPREDLYRLAFQVTRAEIDGLVAVGGGSTIDAAKSSLVLKLYGGVIDDYFGTGLVTEKSGGEQIPLVAVQTASSSGAHLTKYSNITDMETGQKKLIVDESIVPRASVYQYDVSKTMPPGFTKDGALDGVSHSWEVWMGATGKPYYERVSEVAHLSIKLIVNNLPDAVEDPKDLEARYALGLGTDLGGYSIMLGGTNGGHLGSFSLVDLLPHGRACAILNPYYTVLFSDAIQDQLSKLAPVFADAGYIEEDPDELSGRDLGEAVAKGMISLMKDIDYPTTLKEVGADEERIDFMIEAAKNPQLKMKLQNMPTPMDVEAGDVDNLMKPTLEAAYSGDMSLIP